MQHINQNIKLLCQNVNSNEVLESHQNNCRYAQQISLAFNIYFLLSQLYELWFIIHDKINTTLIIQYKGDFLPNPYIFFNGSQHNLSSWSHCYWRLSAFHSTSPIINIFLFYKTALYKVLRQKMNAYLCELLSEGKYIAKSGHIMVKMIHRGQIS